MENLKSKLEYHYKTFDTSEIHSDPILFPHKFSRPLDIELIAYISSIYAYGNVKQILSTLKRIIGFMGDSPVEKIMKEKPDDLRNKVKGIKHRFYSEEDTFLLLQLLKKIYLKEKSIENVFLKKYNSEEDNLKNAINNFSQYMLDNLEKITPGTRFMFALPQKGSACKRMNLFLRWMIRRDKIDFGLWKKIPTSKLIIPVDTHIASISKKLNLTVRSNVSWKMAEEITANLKRYDQEDPVKYDYALCHIGMFKKDF